MSRLLAALALLAAAHAAHPQTLQELATWAGPDREQRLIDGAKREGALVFYTTFPTEYADQLLDPFRAKYGVKVTVWRARSELVLSRVLAEARAGSAGADVVTVIATATEAMRRENLLQEVRSPRQAELIASAVPAHRQWVSQLNHVFVHAYNTTKVRKAELPRAWRDLLDPKWKGRLAIEGDDHEWLSSVIADMGEA